MSFNNCGQVRKHLDSLYSDVTTSIANFTEFKRERPKLKGGIDVILASLTWAHIQIENAIKEAKHLKVRDE